MMLMRQKKLNFSAGSAQSLRALRTVICFG